MDEIGLFRTDKIHDFQKRNNLVVHSMNGFKGLLYVNRKKVQNDTRIVHVMHVSDIEVLDGHYFPITDFAMMAKHYYSIRKNSMSRSAHDPCVRHTCEYFEQRHPPKNTTIIAHVAT